MIFLPDGTEIRKPTIIELTAAVAFKPLRISYGVEIDYTDRMAIEGEALLTSQKLVRAFEASDKRRRVSMENKENRKHLKRVQQWERCCAEADKEIGYVKKAFASLLDGDVIHKLMHPTRYKLPKGTTNMDMLCAIQKLWLDSRLKIPKNGKGKRLAKNVVDMNHDSNRERLVSKTLAADKKRGRPNTLPEWWIEPLRAYYFTRNIGMLRLRRDVCIFEVLHTYKQATTYEGALGIRDRFFGRLDYKKELVFFYILAYYFENTDTTPWWLQPGRLNHGPKEFFFFLPMPRKGYYVWAPDLEFDKYALEAERKEIIRKNIEGDD